MVDLDYLPAMTELAMIVARTTDPRAQATVQRVITDAREAGWTPRQTVTYLENL